MRLTTRRLTWAGLGAGLLLATSTGAFAGCAGADDDDLFAPFDPDRGDTDKDAAGDDDSGSTDEEKDSGGNTKPGKNEPDAQVSDADTDDGGTDPVADGGEQDGGTGTKLNPDKGKISCGDNTCDLSKDVCCSPFGNAIAYCSLKGVPCASNGTINFKRQQCDEEADCPGNQICCLDTSVTGTPGTRCANECKNNEVAICQTHDECGASGKCETYACTFLGLPIGEVNACKQPADSCSKKK